MSTQTRHSVHTNQAQCPHKDTACIQYKQRAEDVLCGPLMRRMHRINKVHKLPKVDDMHCMHKMHHMGHSEWARMGHSEWARMGHSEWARREHGKQRMGMQGTC